MLCPHCSQLILVLSAAGWSPSEIFLPEASWWWFKKHNYVVASTIIILLCHFIAWVIIPAASILMTCNDIVSQFCAGIWDVKILYLCCLNLFLSLQFFWASYKCELLSLPLWVCCCSPAAVLPHNLNIADHVPAKTPRAVVKVTRSSKGRSLVILGPFWGMVRRDSRLLLLPTLTFWWTDHCAAGESNECLLEAERQPFLPSVLLRAAYKLVEAAILWNKQHGLVNCGVLGSWLDLQRWKVIANL